MLDVAGGQIEVVLLHGLFGDKANLGGLKRCLLGSGFRVEAFDLPSHGDAVWLTEPSIQAMADRVYTQLSECGHERVVLIGHSLGGKIAMQIASQHPEMLKAVVVMDIAPVAYSPRHEQVFSALNACLLAQPGSRRELVHLLMESLGDAGVASFLARSGRWNAERFDWCFDLAGLQRQYRDISGMPVMDQPFNGPALVIKAECSDYIVADHWPEVLRRFPKAEFRVVAGAGHWLHVEKPEVVCSVIRRFLNSLS